MIGSAENEVWEQLCVSVKCVCTASFAYHSNPFIHYKKKIITKYSKDHMKQAVSQATELIKLDFLLI